MTQGDILKQIKANREKTESDALQLCRELLNSSKTGDLENTEFSILTDFSGEGYEEFFITDYNNGNIIGNYSGESRESTIDLENLDYEHHVAISEHLIKLIEK